MPKSKPKHYTPSPLRTVRLLLKHTGEVSITSKDPCAVVASVDGDVAVLTDGRTVDLTAKKSCIWTNDDWRGVTVDLYAIVEVDVPAWMSDAALLRDTISMKYALAFGAEVDWPEAWLRLVMSTSDPVERKAYVDLLKADPARMKSAFRKDIRERVLAWLDTPKEERKYASPLSPRQVQALVFAPYEAERLDRAIYSWKGSIPSAFNPRLIRGEK